MSSVQWEVWQVLRVEDLPEDGRIKASFRDVAMADIVITQSGKILKDRYGITKLAGEK